MQETGAINWRNTFSFLAGLICSLILSCGCFIYVFFFLHFDFFGYEDIISPEAVDRDIVLAMLALSLATFAIAWWLKRMGKKYGSIGFCIPLALSLVLLVLFSGKYMIKSNYYQTFNHEVWMKDKPVKMMRKIVKSNLLEGKTKKEVEAMLGKGVSEKYPGDKIGGYFYYDQNYRAYLRVVYINSIVVKADIGCYCD